LAQSITDSASTGAKPSFAPARARHTKHASVLGPLLVAGARGLLRLTWLAVIPLLGAAVLCRYALPTPLTGFALERPVEIGVVVFVALAALINYWRFYLPGGRFIAKLPLDVASSAPVSSLRDLESASRAARGGMSHGRRQAVQLGLFVLGMGLAVAVAQLIRQKLLIYRVLSSSMVPTAQVDDLLIGDRDQAKVPPKRGDIVVFRDTTASGPPFLIKRVIGVPGDEIIMNSGRPYINRWAVPKCDAGRFANVLPGGGYLAGRLVVEFLDDRAYLTMHAPERKQSSPYVVQPGEVFVVGDNRNSSLDSRAWHEHGGSGVPISEIVARVDRSLFHTSRAGRAAWETLLKPVQQLGLNLDELEASGLREGVSRCLASRPAKTTPPTFNSSEPQPSGFPLPAAPRVP
jgi:signal peptidase I